MIIDVHAHVISEELLAEWAGTKTFGIERGGDGAYIVPGYGPWAVGLYRHEARLEGLAARGVDLQLVCPIPTLLNWPGGAADVAFARALNQSTAACVARSGGRFAGLAALALGEPERAVDELDRALGEYGFVGAAIATYAGDRPLDDPTIEPVFDALERRELLVFMHPTTGE